MRTLVRVMKPLEPQENSIRKQLSHSPKSHRYSIDTFTEEKLANDEDFQKLRKALIEQNKVRRVLLELKGGERKKISSENLQILLLESGL